MAKFGEETLDRWVGRPFDYALFQLERAAKERNKELENFTGYIKLCSVLTKLDFDEPVPFSTKEWCYHKMISLIEWVFIGDCISAPGWLQRTIAHFDEMQRRLHMKLFPGDIGFEPSLEPPEDDREIIDYCAECGEPIREGDDFYLLMNCCFCEACVDDARRCG